MLTDVRAIVFDLDGTLVDSIIDIVAHLNAALVDHGLAAHDIADIGEWVGYGAEQLVVRAVPREDLVAPVLATFRARYRSRPVIDTHVYEGLPAVLDAIAGHYELAVLSNKPHELTVDVCGALLSRWPFRVIHGQRADRPRKPDPAALGAVASELGVDVRACVLVGDSEVDVATARAAGVTSIGVSWGLRPLAVLTDARPDYIVHTPQALAALLQQRGSGSALR
jgi:phosphoglycolate phosphatase